MLVQCYFCVVKITQLSVTDRVVVTTPVTMLSRYQIMTLSPCNYHTRAVRPYQPYYQCHYRIVLFRRRPPTGLRGLLHWIFPRFNPQWGN